MQPPADGSPTGRPRSPKHGPLEWALADRSLLLLLAATFLCYAIGYPLALVGHSNVGWIFVFLGGPLLIAVFVAVIRRVHPRCSE